MKKCQKENCISDSIPRGKYCQEHRCRNKKKPNKLADEEEERLSQMLIRQIIEDENKINNKNNSIYDEDRLLKAQQEQDYLEAQKQDMENIRKKEIEIEKKTKIRMRLLDRIPQSTDIILQFTFPKNNLKVRHGFSCKSVVSDLYDFVDILMEDNNIKHFDYRLIMYPNTVFEKSNKMLVEVDIKSGLSFFITE